MTHDELQDKLEDWAITMSNYRYISDALRAVVELHKPIFYPDKPEGPIWCNQCAEGRGYAKYPCPTIQTIEKELG